MNAFYASVEILLRPELAGQRLAVVGSRADRHGIVLAKSQEAKIYGVKTGEAIWEAQSKCPGLILVEPHYEAYLHFSRLARKVYAEYSERVESYGLDEAWLDLSGTERLFGSGEAVADELRRRFREELHLTISVGVSFNKVFAKFGSDYQKPDATTVIRETDYQRLIWPRPVEELLGVGPATRRKLAKLGIRTIGELACSPINVLERLLGVAGRRLHAWANGLDQGQVKLLGETIPVQSVGHGVTTRYDLESPRQVGEVFRYLARDVSYRLQAAHYKAVAVQISVKDQHFLTREYQTPLPYPAHAASSLAATATELFERNHHFDAPIRALGLRAIQLRPADEAVQSHIFANWETFQKREKLSTACYQLAQKYGDDIVLPARSLQMDYVATNPPLPIQPPGLPEDCQNYRADYEELLSRSS